MLLNMYDVYCDKILKNYMYRRKRWSGIDDSFPVSGIKQVKSQESGHSSCYEGKETRLYWCVNLFRSNQIDFDYLDKYTCRS